MANTTRRRVWREMLLAVFIGAALVPWGAATAKNLAALGDDVYGWEPLGVIAGSSELRMHSMGEDVWEVWLCDTPDGSTAVNLSYAVATLNTTVGLVYEWMSEGAYQPVFRAGGAVVENGSCANSVRESVTSQPNGVLIITDEAANGGSAQSGIWCPYEGLCPDSPETYPDNYRTLTVGAHAVVGANPRLVTVVHELGHTIHFGHSFSGAASGTWAEYDNPIDVMSKAGDRTKLMGTLGLNRYIAGWIEPYDVGYITSPGTYTVAAVGSAGDQLLMIPNGEQGWLTVVDARVQQVYDAGLPVAGVTVHVLDQRPEACDSPFPCFGLSRRVQQYPAESGSYAHVFGVGEEIELINGWRLAVVEQRGGTFTVELHDSTAPEFAGPVWVQGVEATSATLVWDPATDSGPVSYEVAIDGTLQMTVDGSTATIVGLEPDSSYEAVVTAVDGSGNRSAAHTAQLTTLSPRAQVALHDPRRGVWTLRLGEGAGYDFYYGVPGDLAMMCDWDGDGVDTVGLYRPYSGFVYLRNSNTIGFADVDFYFGIPTDQPVCGDWDGDGVDSVGIFRGGEGRFYLRNSNTFGFSDVTFDLGGSASIPLAGDWDGDGVDTVAVLDPETGLLTTADGESWSVPATSAQPVVGDWNGDGSETPALYLNGVLNILGGESQQLIRFGSSAHTALAGWWG